MGDGALLFRFDCCVAKTASPCRYHQDNQKSDVCLCEGSPRQDKTRKVGVEERNNDGIRGRKRPRAK